MIALEDNSLSFTFPDIPNQLRSHLERHIQTILPKFTLPANRRDLVSQLAQDIRSTGDWTAPPNTPMKSVYATAESLTDADVEAALRQATLSRAGIVDSLATLTVTFQRTLRIPDDGRINPLPAGLGEFPVRSVDDFSEAVPAKWMQRGGVMMPMYQSEDLWINFSSSYPFALEIGAGRINAVSGESWSPDLQREPQNYVVIPEQPWLDGFSVGNGVIRQFVAMPLGSGYSVEEQLTGKAEFGGIQLRACPMHPESHFRDSVVPELPSSLRELLPALFNAHLVRPRICRAPAPGGYSVSASMGFGAGGTMRQEIYKDPYPFDDWDQSQSARCFVHLCNSMIWRQITGANPPHPPLTAREYKQSGIPWYDYYRDDLQSLTGSKQLAGAKSVTQIGKEKNSHPLPENTSVAPETIIQYGNTRRLREIREFLDAP
jgi:hypothetical protein